MLPSLVIGASSHDSIEGFLLYDPKKVLTGKNKIYLEESIIIEYTVVNNKPDIALIAGNTKDGYVINNAVSSLNLTKQCHKKLESTMNCARNFENFIFNLSVTPAQLKNLTCQKK